MTIEAICNSCQNKFLTHASTMGQSIVCPRCKMPFLVGPQNGEPDFNTDQFPSLTDDHFTYEWVCENCTAENWLARNPEIGQLVECKVCKAKYKVANIIAAENES
jgi:uncharacterized protein YbaR (Trm112 family)